MLTKPGSAKTATAGSRGFQGWKIARAGLVIQMIHSGLVFNAFSFFADELRTEFGWSKGVLGGAFAMNRAESGLLGPLQGWMTDRWGSRWVLRLGAVFMALGFLAFSQIQTVVQFYLSFLLIALGSSLAGFLTITVTLVHWFERHRSKALALASMGFALGGILAFAVGVTIDAVGWRNTSLIAAIITPLAILPMAQIFDRRPADVGLTVDGLDPVDAPAPTKRSESTISTVHFTATEAMRTRAFWFISFGHASALLVVGASMAHLDVFLTDETSLGSLHRNFVVGTVPLMMGVGQLIGGYLGDEFDKRIIITIAMLGHGAGLIVLAAASTAPLVWVFVVLHGVAWGLRGPLQQALRADYFGATDFGKIMGFSALIIMLGMTTGPIVAGVVADTTDSFRPAFVGLGIAAGLGSFWFWFATPPAPPVRNVGV
jgi:MFS family permease